MVLNVLGLSFDPTLLLPTKSTNRLALSFSLPITDPINPFFHSSALMFLTTLNRIAAEITQNLTLFGTKPHTNMLKALSATSGSYQKRQHNTLEQFFHILSNHDTFKPLSKFIANPELPVNQIRQFYVTLWGAKTQDKKIMLNAALIIFGQMLILKAHLGKDLSDLAAFAAAQYQPNVVIFHYKMLSNAATS